MRPADLRPRPANRLCPQRLSAAGFSSGLRYFGRSVHGILDVSGDGLVDVAVGALGAAVIIRSDARLSRFTCT